MTREERLNKLVDHIYKTYMPIVIAALRDNLPLEREIVAGLTKEDLRSFWRQETKTYPKLTKEVSLFATPMNTVDFFMWHASEQEFNFMAADQYVHEYIEKWFGCSFQELMLPKDI